MKCSDAALIFWTHIVLFNDSKMDISLWRRRLCRRAARTSCDGPLVQSLRFERVDAVDVRDVKEGLVAGRVGRHLHQNLVQKQRLRARQVGRSNPGTASAAGAPCPTVLYIFSWTLDLRLKSLSGPEEEEEEENCLALCVRRRKSLKRKAHSSLLLLVLCRRPLCSSLRGPRQFVSEPKTKCWKRARVRR